MERDTNRRRLSTDSGAPSSNLDGENQRHETELKQPINRHRQFRNFTRHGGKSGNMSDASSVTSYNPQTSDTETSMNVIREVEKVIGKRPSKKGKESPYNVHIGTIVIHNNPIPESPYYYDHPPPPPCADANYTYIKDQETRSVYNNIHRDPIEQGSTPRNNSMEIREEEEELHAMINPYRETDDFVIGQRTTTNRIPEAEFAGSIHVKNDKDYGYIVKNPELNIDDANGELEITLRMGGSKQMVYSGKLIPNLKQVPPSENTIPQDTTPYTQHEPDGPRVAEEPQAQQVNAPTDAFAMQDNRVLAATSQATPTNGLAHGNVTSTRAVSAPDLAQQSSDIRNLQIQTGLSQNQNNFNISSSVPGISTISPDNQVYGRGNDLVLPQPQKSRPKSEKSLFNFSKSKVKQRHMCNIDGIIYSGEERFINRIREDLLEYGKEAMWQLVKTKNQPTHPFSLLVNISGQVLTYPISEDKKGKFSIDNKHKKTFPCLCSLVNYYKSNTMPMVALNLGPRYIHSPPSPVQYISPTYIDSAEFTNTRL